MPTPIPIAMQWMTITRRQGQLAWRIECLRWRKLACRGYAGCYTVTPDGKLIIDQAPGVEGLYIGAGFSGTGFKISPAVGIALAELATQGRATTVDVTPFSATRFSEGRMLRAQYEYLDRPYDPVETASGVQLQPDTQFDR